MRSAVLPGDSVEHADLTEASRFPNQREFDSTCWLGWRPAWMTAAYSQDLRDRVIDAVEKDGMSRRAAAQRFGVSESAAIKWMQGVERRGSRKPVGTGGHRPEVLKPHHDFLMA